MINEANVNKQIIRLTTSITYKFQTGTQHDRVVLGAALNILTQAMVVSTSSPSDAMRLYSLAMKTANLAHGKSTV